MKSNAFHRRTDRPKYEIILQSIHISVDEYIHYAGEPKRQGNDWSQLFTEWLPFRPHVCPSVDPGSNEQYTMVQTHKMHCRSSVQRICYHYHQDHKTRRGGFHLSTIYNGHCSGNITTCSNFECKRSCVDGYHRDSNGKCVNTVALTCFNGGSLNLNLTKCVCPANFTGDQCDIPICSPSCKNGGVCSLPPNSRCHCPDYLTGTRCEIPLCGTGCRNGGECVFTGITSQCVCRPDFTGHRCESYNDYLQECAASDEVDNSTICFTDEQCGGLGYCCSLSPRSYYGHCSMPENNITCIHSDGAVVAKNDIYNSVRDCEVCVCSAPVNTSAEHGDIQCTSSGCSGDFLSNSICCPNTTDNKPCPPPVIKGCPDKDEILPVVVSSHYNNALLVNNFDAHNCLGDFLHVKLDRVYFSACECSTPSTYTVTATSERDFNNRQGTCDFRVVVKDITPPIFISCPADIYIRQGETVSWNKPKAADNVGIKQLNLYNSNIKNNSMDVGPGVYFLHYTAIDWQDNMAFCRFKVNVYKNDDSKYPLELKERKTSVSPVIIGGTVAGVLCVTLIALVIALVRVWHIRKKRLQDVQRRQQQLQPVDIFSIYTNDPPPYEVAAKHKLPEYSASDNPPTYDDVTKEAYDNPSYASTEEIASTSEGMRSEMRSTGSKRVTVV
ncbi:uncharacterized protein LOC132547885 [Ylistrum balloti]|uniref:uncharacterized protein LOC132547885 n=1 Tax=Ylistrum balloti TaxID=509963 RepID=UPI002905E9DE|nr:uncharacterized protein LOC132547885 [Ylistrum balloti]